MYIEQKKNSNIKCKQSKTKNKKVIVTLGKESGERSKKGCREETEDRRNIKEARKVVLLKGEEKKEEMKCKEEAK